MPRIVLDAMGSDRNPEAEIRAAQLAADEFQEELILVGPETVLKSKVEALGSKNVRVVHAPDVFKMTDHLSGDDLRQAQTSMAVGLKLVKNGEADAFVTMGNTGGAMANGLYHLRRIRGVKRPALTALIPVEGSQCVFLDIGANAICKPDFLLQFAVMGSVYAQTVLGVAHPRVGLLSNGEEEGKGNDLVKETFPLLASSGLNFIGNVEGKEFFGGKADVVVTDGFTGNIVLKNSEALAKMMVNVLRTEIYSSLRTKIGGVLVRPAFDALRTLLDPSEYGAVPLLGLEGLVFVGHGRSEAGAIVNGIRAARTAVDAQLLDSIKAALQEGLRQNREANG